MSLIRGKLFNMWAFERVPEGSNPITILEERNWKKRLDKVKVLHTKIQKKLHGDGRFFLRSFLDWDSRLNSKRQKFSQQFSPEAKKNDAKIFLIQINQEPSRGTGITQHFPASPQAFYISVFRKNSSC